MPSEMDCGVSLYAFGAVSSREDAKLARSRLARGAFGAAATWRFMHNAHFPAFLNSANLTRTRSGS